jgi:hypothetical protein
MNIWGTGEVHEAGYDSFVQIVKRYRPDNGKIIVLRTDAA